MSIEMENPQTAIEKIDAAANLIEQMNMAHMISDEEHFKICHQKAGKFLFAAMIQLEKDGEGVKTEDVTP